jgi:hypothetical protein
MEFQLRVYLVIFSPIIDHEKFHKRIDLILTIRHIYRYSQSTL